MYGKENRLSLSQVALPPAPSVSMSTSVLGSSTSGAALSLGTTNKRQQMLKYSKSRRLSLKPTHRRGKVSEKREREREREREDKKLLYCT